METAKTPANAEKAIEPAKEYAVVKTGGQQFRVAAGQRLTVNRLVGEVGTGIDLESVLLVVTPGQAPKIGVPTLTGAKVSAKIVAQRRGSKVIIYKKNRRTGYTKKQGHRQELTDLVIQSINA